MIFFSLKNFFLLFEIVPDGSHIRNTSCHFVIISQLVVNVWALSFLNMISFKKLPLKTRAENYWWKLQLKTTAEHYSWTLQLKTTLKTTAEQYIWTLQLNSTAENYSWTLQLKATAENYSWTLQLKTTTENYSWTLQLKTTAGNYSWKLQLKTTAEHYSWKLQRKLQLNNTAVNYSWKEVMSWCVRIFAIPYDLLIQMCPKVRTCIVNLGIRHWSLSNADLRINLIPFVRSARITKMKGSIIDFHI